MENFLEMSSGQLKATLDDLTLKYNHFKNMNLNLDMSRGKPCSEQLDISNEMLDVINSSSDFIAKNNIDVRNYGTFDGITELKEFISELTDIKKDMLSLGYDEKYICDVLVKHLFGVTKSINKRAFWSIYGDIVYNNLCRNIDENFFQCDKCKTRFYVRKVGQTVCDKCLEKEKQRQERLRKQQISSISHSRVLQMRFMN